MPKLICPNCAKFVTVPDEAAGTTVPCPECHAPFPVPARYDPVVSVPVVPTPPPASPPPGGAPTPPPGLVPEAAPPAAQPGSMVWTGYTRTVGITLRPGVFAWIPAVGFTLILLLTPFTWVASYVAGHPVYSQGAWGSLWGTATRDFRLEKMAREQAGWPADVLNKVTSDWPLMLPYMLLLFLAVAVAWAERTVTDVDRARLPRKAGFIAEAWPHRALILVGLAVVTVVLLFCQSARGFGLERALRQAVAERFAEAREKAKENPAALAEINFNAGEELNKFNLERSVWFELVVGFHLVVVLAMGVQFWLDRRGNRPPPRLVLQY